MIYKTIIHGWQLMQTNSSFRTDDCVRWTHEKAS